MMSPGRGQFTIMAAGFMIRLMDGFGFLAQNGRQPGFTGERATITLVGRRADREG